MHEAHPNGRDYYVQGPTALAAAQREHVARIVCVTSVLAEYEQILESIADQRDARNGR